MIRIISIYIVVSALVSCAGSNSFSKINRINYLMDELVVFQLNDRDEWCLGFCVQHPNGSDTLMWEKGVVGIKRVGFKEDTLALEVYNRNKKRLKVFAQNDGYWQFLGRKKSNEWQLRHSQLEEDSIEWKYLPQDLGNEDILIISHPDDDPE